MCSPVINWISPILFAKPLLCTEDGHAHHNYHLVSDFCLQSPALPPQHTHMSWDHRQSPLKALLNIFGMHHNDSFDKYCEEADTCYPLHDLLEQFQQLKNQFASLKSNTSQSTTTEEMSQLTDKLQHLTMALQPVPQLSEEPVHKTMQAHTNTLHATQRESNLTTTMLQDIPTFDWQDSSKLEDWFIDIETTTGILTESHTCLTKAKSCGLTCTLIHKATQRRKWWDEIKGILRLKFYNANINTDTSRFMEINKKTMKLWLPTSIASKQ